MKKKFLSVFIIVFYVVAVVSCSTDDSSSNDNSNNVTANQTETIAQEGTWKITYFFDTDQAETGNYSGYTFSFNNDGSLEAVNGDSTITGSWSVSDSNSSDDDASSSDTDFNIFFPVADNDNLEELNDDWHVISVSDSKIELIDVSGGNGGTDYLTFEKL